MGRDSAGLAESFTPPASPRCSELSGGLGLTRDHVKPPKPSKMQVLLVFAFRLKTTNFFQSVGLVAKVRRSQVLGPQRETIFQRLHGQVCWLPPVGKVNGAWCGGCFIPHGTPQPQRSPRGLVFPMTTGMACTGQVPAPRLSPFPSISRARDCPCCHGPITTFSEFSSLQPCWEMPQWKTLPLAPSANSMCLYVVSPGCHYGTPTLGITGGLSTGLYPSDWVRNGYMAQTH